MLKILVIGQGGREHAMAWKLAQSSQVEQIFVAPGNPGTELCKKTSNISIDPLDFPSLMQFVKQEGIHFTIVGPELPLSHGIVDAFSEAGLPCLGPTQKAAQLETSKAFCKDFMQRQGIPTASYQSFTDLNGAIQYLHNQTLPIVIKADGLAAGKGVFIATDYKEAEEIIDQLLSGKALGEAGQRIVLEEYLEGKELSFIVLTDGKNIVSMSYAQDHKKRDEGEKGPNTGGMGAFSPSPMVDQKLFDQIMLEVIKPTITGMAKEGIPYSGFLFAGLMIDHKQQIKVLEFNCRLGDPETEVILPRLKTDFALLCQAATQGELETIKMLWDERYALGVVLTAQGYPEKYATGALIQGLKNNYEDPYQLFHAGTHLENQNIYTHGGRVLCATGLGGSLKEAQTKAYELVSQIHWEGMYFRKDIGDK